jgi:hypothetical protein
MGESALSSWLMLWAITTETDTFDGDLTWLRLRIGVFTLYNCLTPKIL